MRVLAIGAHFDDVELGCGGTLLAWKARGDDVSLFVASDSGYSDPSGKPIRESNVARDEGKAVAARLGAELIEANIPTFEVVSDERLHAPLLAALERVRPDVVLSHWAGDPHHDHRQVALATLHTARRIPRVLVYRSNWDPPAQPPPPGSHPGHDSRCPSGLHLPAGPGPAARLPPH